MARRTKSRPRVLLILSCLLLASAVVRGAEVAGPALAAVAEQVEKSDTEPNAEDDGKVDALLASLLKREARLEDREQRLNERLAMLEVAEAELSDMIEALEAAEENLASTIALSETASSDDIALLTRVYQQMKPKDAAAVFGQMTPEFAAGFLGEMKPDAAAAILSGLSPEKAYGISVLLAGRNAAAPTE